MNFFMRASHSAFLRLTTSIPSINTLGAPSIAQVRLVTSLSEVILASYESIILSEDHTLHFVKNAGSCAHARVDEYSAALVSSLQDSLARAKSSKHGGSLVGGSG